MKLQVNENIYLYSKQLINGFVLLILLLIYYNTKYDELYSTHFSQKIFE